MNTDISRARFLSGLSQREFAQALQTHNENQTPPAWITSIKAIDELVKLQSDKLFEDEDYCEAFRKRGFLVVRNCMYFV